MSRAEQYAQQDYSGMTGNFTGQNEAVDIGGYAFGQFPAGRLPAGGVQGGHELLMDSDAFTGMRGVQRERYPLGSHPASDDPDRTSRLADSFDTASMASLTPGAWGVNRGVPALGPDILRAFDVGGNTLLSLPGAAGPYADEVWGNAQQGGWRDTPYTGGHEPANLVDLHRSAYSRPGLGDDVPALPFQRSYVNFGNGEVDYGASSDASTLDGAALARMHRLLPRGELAGMKTDLMPVFSSIPQTALEQRPLFQSLGKQRGQRFLGGTSVLPDELTIDPREAILAGSAIPANMPQTAGELASYLGILGARAADGLATSSPFGAPVGTVKMVSGESAPMSADFYCNDGVGSMDPASFSDRYLKSAIHDAALGRQ